MSRPSAHTIVSSVTIFVLATLTTGAGARTCLPLDSCSCKFDDDGTIVSLNALAFTDGTPRFTQLSDQDHGNYSYNPCVPFMQSGCKDSVICRQNGSMWENLADKRSAVTVKYSEDNSTLSITYKSGNIVSSVSAECVQGMEDPEFSVLGEVPDEPSSYYFFRLRTKCACPDACPTPMPSGDSGGLGTGSVLLIVIVAVLALYLVLGTVYGRVVKKASGPEMIPNYEFWRAVPGYCKDGCQFLVTCACCQPQRKQYDEV